MRIAGLQKLTLLDYPGKTAATVFLPGCNFRCPFCHNASLVLRASEQPHISEEELFSFLKKRKGLLDGVCVTGGEPTIYPDLAELLTRIRELGYCVKLDTNGTNPAVLRDLLNNKLIDYIAMDIKASPERYGILSGIRELDFAPVRESVSLLMKSGVKYEFRTTVVDELHKPEDFSSIGQLIRGADRYFLQCYRDSGDIISPGFSAPSAEKLLACLEAARPFVPSAELRGADIAAPAE